MLPVVLTCDRFPSEEREQLGRAWFDRGGLDEGAVYLLYVDVADQDGQIGAALRTAFDRAIISGEKWKHVRCLRNLEPTVREPEEWRALQAADKAHLKAVDRGEARLGELGFDRLSFDDAATSTAPAWSWSWADWEFDRPGYQHAPTAKWRAKHLPYR